MKMSSRVMLLACALSMATCPVRAESKNLLTAKNEKQTPAKHERESLLGDISIGDRESDVRIKLRSLRYGDEEDTYVNDHWNVWIDRGKKTVKGICFEERTGILRSQPYPKTGGGITLGSSPAEVEKAYGPPERVLMGKAPFVLRTSEHAIISVYPFRGLWIMFTNQTPYSGNADWRASLILIGTENMIDNILAAARQYASPLTTKQEQDRIVALYKKNFGKQSIQDLNIFDDFQYVRETALTEHIKTQGDYAITPLMILPRDERKAKALISDLVPTGQLTRKLEQSARKKISEKYKISDSDLDRIIMNIKKLDAILAGDDTAIKNAAASNKKVLAGQSK